SARAGARGGDRVERRRLRPRHPLGEPPDGRPAVHARLCARRRRPRGRRSRLSRRGPSERRLRRLVPAHRVPARDVRARVRARGVACAVAVPPAAAGRRTGARAHARPPVRRRHARAVCAARGQVVLLLARPSRVRRLSRRRRDRDRRRRPDRLARRSRAAGGGFRRVRARARLARRDPRRVRADARALPIARPARALPRRRGDRGHTDVLARGARDSQGSTVGPPGAAGRLCRTRAPPGRDGRRAESRAGDDRVRVARRRARARVRDGARRALPAGRGRRRLRRRLRRRRTRDGLPALLRRPRRLGALALDDAAAPRRAERIQRMADLRVDRVGAHRGLRARLAELHAVRVAPLAGGVADARAAARGRSPSPPQGLVPARQPRPVQPQVLSRVGAAVRGLRAPARPAARRPRGSRRRVVPPVPVIAFGLVLAAASAIAINGGYALQHAAAGALPPLTLRSPLRSLLSLARSGRWLLGFTAGLGGWVLYVAALRVAPLSLVQAAAAGGLGVAAAVSGLLLLAVSLQRHAPHSRASLVAVGIWLGVSAVGAAAAVVVLPGGAGLGTAAGVLYAAGDVATKAAVAGGAGLALVPAVLAAHGLAFVCLQLAFQRGGRIATAGLAVLWTNALPIAAGTVIFAEGLPPGWRAPVRAAAFALVV